MPQGNWPLTVKSPSVGSAWCKVMGDAFDGCQVGRLVIKT